MKAKHFQLVILKKKKKKCVPTTSEDVRIQHLVLQVEKQVKKLLKQGQRMIFGVYGLFKLSLENSSHET